MPDSAAQTDEQDFAIPGQQDDNQGIRGGDTGSSDQTSPSPASTASAGPSAQPPMTMKPGSGGEQLSPQDQARSNAMIRQQLGLPPDQQPKVDTSEKIHPHVAILAGLANKFISAIQNAPGNPNNAFDRGFMNASPQNQQLQKAQVSKAMSEADQAKAQASLMGIQALNAEYMWKRLPQDLQEKHLKDMVDIQKFMVEHGAQQESTGDHDAIKADVMHSNGTDPRVLNHSGTLMAMPTGEETKDGRPEFAKVFFPSKNTLQEDFPYKDAEGNDQVIKAGTQMLPAMAQLVKNQSSQLQADTKEQHKLMGDALGPVPDEKAAGTADWLAGQKATNSSVYQANKDAVEAAIPRLQARAQQARSDKIAQASAMATRVEIPKAAAIEDAKTKSKNANNYYHWQGSDGETRVGKGSEVPEDVEATPIGNADKFATYQNESHTSNIVQDSLNRIHQDVDQHPEIFDNAAASNILSTTLGQIDRSSVGLLVAGTGGAIPLPSGTGAMINKALQNKALDPETADAVKQYIADYKAMKDKGLVMQMEMQGGKIGRGSGQGFKSIVDQIPDGETPDSKTAHRQLNNLQAVQKELSEKYGNYGDFKKIEPYKPLDTGKSSTSKAKDAARESKWEAVAKEDKTDPVSKAIKNVEDKGVMGAMKDLGAKEKEIFKKLFGKD